MRRLRGWFLLLLFSVIFVVDSSTSIHILPIYHSIVPPKPDYPHYFLYLPSNRSFIPRYQLLPPGSPSLNPEFRNKRATYKFRSFSQDGQDMVVLNILKDMDRGYFLDVAANDYRTISNTFLLEEFNLWTGICIEPLPQLWPGHLINRRCQLYVNPVSHKSGENVTFHIEEGVSGIVGSEFDKKTTEGLDSKTLMTLQTTTLKELMRHAQAPKIIHYMSLDIEGAEFVAMSGFDFSAYTIYVLTVERPKAKLHSLFALHGYLFLRSLTFYGECLYVHHTIPDFLDIYNKYYNAAVPTWSEQTHPYLLQPVWQANITLYINNAKRIAQQHKLIPSTASRSQSHSKKNSTVTFIK